MGVMDKIKFWKKDDDLGDMGDLGAEKGVGGDMGLDEHKTGLDLGPTPGGEEPTGGPEAPSLPGADKGLGLEPVEGGAEAPQALKEMPQTPPAAAAPAAGGASSELLSSKLDAIKATLDNINLRLTNLENIAKGEENKGQW